MADASFATHGASVAVADVEGILGSHSGGALFGISQALHGLVTSLDSSLKEFRDVENMLELEAAGGIGNAIDGPDSVVSDEARPELLLAVAGILKGMVEALVSDIKANAQVQELLPAIQKASVAEHHGFFQDLMNIPTHQQFCSVDAIAASREETQVCTSSGDSRAAKRVAAGKGRLLVCKHSCKHHQEVVDPWLWRNLPQELVELVFAGFPLLHIIDLCWISKTWSAMSFSSNFSRAFSERYPKLVGLLQWEQLTKKFLVTLYDVQSQQWLAQFEVACFLHHYGDSDAYKNSMYACDGGLVCFVPFQHLASSPILVFNPLSDVLRTLPLIPLGNLGEEIIMVQLVTEDESKSYTVILVSRQKVGQVFSAHCYYSETGVWSIMDSGLVYGASSKLTTGCGAPYVFDCATKAVRNLKSCNSFDSVQLVAYSLVRDRLFVLHPSTRVYEPRSTTYYVSQYTWESSVSDLRRLERIRSKVKFYAGYTPVFFASHGFLLLIVDNREAQSAINQNNHHQQTWLLDLSANDMSFPPPLNPHLAQSCGIAIPLEDLERSFMCELRWGATP